MDKVLFSVIYIWLLILTALIIRIYLYFRKLSKGVDKGNLTEVIRKILARYDVLGSEVKDIQKVLSRVIENDTFHLQKFGIVKFNPFKEMGGDHSFSLALLDGNLTGFVFTGLHTRERTRIYVKKINKGKPEHELSDEERIALKKAMKKD